MREKSRLRPDSVDLYTAADSCSKDSERRLAPLSAMASSTESQSSTRESAEEDSPQVPHFPEMRLDEVRRQGLLLRNATWRCASGPGPPTGGTRERAAKPCGAS